MLRTFNYTGKGGTIANPMTSGEVDDIINNIDLNMIGDYSIPEQMIKVAIKQLSAGLLFVVVDIMCRKMILESL